MTARSLPYFDFIFDRIAADDLFADTFRDHVHWGLFQSPPANGRVTAQQFKQATLNLTAEITKMSDTVDGMRILDVGCGFGGTARYLATAFPNSEISALNIDPKQIAYARSITESHSITFVEGDACAMPFADRQFDRVLAVESVFHFPSRLAFLREARRVMKKGGTLVISDFVIRALSLLPVAFRTIISRDPMRRFYGPVNATTLTAYRVLASLAGLTLEELVDVTILTLPTYQFLKQLGESMNLVGSLPDEANRFMDFLARKGQLRYMLLKFSG